MKSDGSQAPTVHAPKAQSTSEDAVSSLPASEDDVCAEGGHELVIGQDLRSCWCGQRVEETKDLPCEDLATVKNSSTLKASVTMPGVDMRARVRWEAKWLLRCALVLTVAVFSMIFGLRHEIDALAIGAGSVAFIAFCFTGLSAVDTFVAWRSRHEIFDSSDIEFLTAQSSQRTSRRSQHH